MSRTGLPCWIGSASPFMMYASNACESRASSSVGYARSGCSPLLPGTIPLSAAQKGTVKLHP